jgi:UDPglucose 6-dehydrogenase
VRITVIGCGRLGTPYTVGLAELGHDVVGVDINPVTLAALQAGRCPFPEPGISEYIQKNAAAGRLRWTDSYDDAVAHGELFFLAVPTPQREGAATMDVSAVEHGITEVARRLDRDAVLIGKSTVPVGTAERMARLAAAEVRPGVRLRIGWSPDFLREAMSMDTTLRPARVVLGTSREDREAVETVARRTWAGMLEAGAELLVTDFATADMTKAAANAFLATKISFTNLLDDVCRAAGADITVVARSMGLEPRIGQFGLTPGLGWGGSCLGKDIRAFSARAEDLGVQDAAAFLSPVDRSNSARRQLAVDHARVALGGRLDTSTIGVWGASFKPGVGDISDSPALDVALRLHRAGAEVRVYDPSVHELIAQHHPELTMADTAAGAVEDAQLLMVLTDWPEFTDADPAALGGHTAARTVIDGRRCLDAARWESAGWTYQPLGYSGPPAATTGR